MQIEYRELMTDQEFEQCVDIQRQVFGFSEKDLVSPLLFKLVSRNQPPMGYTMGVFRNNGEQDELIGFILGFATYLESSVYVVLLAVKSEHQNSVYGFRLLSNYRQLLLSKGIKTLLGVYEPLENNLGRLYCHSFGYFGTKYIIDANSADKLYVEWDMASEHALRHLERNDRENADEALKSYPIVEDDFSYNSEKLLVEIPDGYIRLKQKDLQLAWKWRIKTRNIFDEYINLKHYRVSDCIFVKTTEGKKYYYILEKTSL